jgi:hypothetical protein
MPIDFDALVNTPIVGMFGEPALVQRPGFDDITVNGVFDSRYFALDDQGQIGASALVTTFGFRIRDIDPRPLGLLYLVPSNTTFTIRRVIYKLSDIKPDSEGWATAILERAYAPPPG